MPRLRLAREARRPHLGQGRAGNAVPRLPRSGGLNGVVLFFLIFVAMETYATKTASPQSTTGTQGKASAILQRIEGIMMEIAKTDSRLSSLVERIDSPRVQPDGSDKKPYIPSGLLGRLSDIADRLESLSGGMANSTAQLEDML